jgi:hypothetical protein
VHLNGEDLRYKRKQARIVPRAGLVVVLAAALLAVHDCAVLQVAALEQTVLGGPVGPAVQAPPVVLPVGAVLGVFLGPVAVRGHAEPAGEAALVLPSVGPAFHIIHEHAAADDTDAVEGPSIPYDRRHATFVLLISVPCHLTNRVIGGLRPS